MGNPNWKPGVSGNPRGRPRGAAGLAEYIRSITRDGAELADIAIDIARNPRARDRDRLAAVELLKDRAFGKPEQTIQLEASIKPAGPALPEPDYESMSLADLEALDQILTRAPLRLPEGDVIDATSSEAPVDPGKGTPA